MSAAAKIAGLIKRATGLDADCLGAATLERAVQIGFRQSGLATLDDYRARLEHSAEARGKLIEELVIPETWFFRGPESFAALGHWARTEWLPAHAGRTLNVLSVPCSTGEEPYSIAMTLLDSGVPAGKFHIDALDISARSIAVARRAVYRKNSFREKKLDCRARYFQATAGEAVLREAVRGTVSFRIGNLLAPDFPAAANFYHLIFCRNLLIYFDRQTQRHAIESYRGWLAPGGLIFVGHAEAGLLPEHGFASVNFRQAFAFRKLDQARNGQQAALRQSAAPELFASGWRKTEACWSSASALGDGVPPRRTVRRPGVATSSGKMAARMEQPVMSAALREAHGHSRDQSMNVIQKLADQGRLREAAELCQTHLREEGATATAYYWLGVVHDAAGKLDLASDCYRKAIYLKPDHAEALWQITLLAEKRGQREEARRWRRRAERVEARGRP